MALFFLSIEISFFSFSSRRKFSPIKYSASSLSRAHRAFRIECCWCRDELNSRSFARKCLFDFECEKFRRALLAARAPSNTSKVPSCLSKVFHLFLPYRLLAHSTVFREVSMRRTWWCEAMLLISFSPLSALSGWIYFFLMGIEMKKFRKVSALLELMSVCFEEEDIATRCEDYLSTKNHTLLLKLEFFFAASCRLLSHKTRNLNIQNIFSLETRNYFKLNFSKTRARAKFWNFIFFPHCINKLFSLPWSIESDMRSWAALQAYEKRRREHSW